MNPTTAGRSSSGRKTKSARSSGGKADQRDRKEQEIRLGKGAKAAAEAMSLPGASAELTGTPPGVLAGPGSDPKPVDPRDSSTQRTPQATISQGKSYSAKQQANPVKNPLNLDLNLDPSSGNKKGRKSVSETPFTRSRAASKEAAGKRKRNPESSSFCDESGNGVDRVKVNVAAAAATSSKRLTFEAALGAEDGLIAKSTKGRKSKSTKKLVSETSNPVFVALNEAVEKRKRNPETRFCDEVKPKSGLDVVATTAAATASTSEAALGAVGDFIAKSGKIPAKPAKTASAEKKPAKFEKLEKRQKTRKVSFCDEVESNHGLDAEVTTTAATASISEAALGAEDDFIAKTEEKKPAKLEKLEKRLTGQILTVNLFDINSAQKPAIKLGQSAKRAASEAAGAEVILIANKTPAEIPVEKLLNATIPSSKEPSDLESEASLSKEESAKRILSKLKPFQDQFRSQPGIRGIFYKNTEKYVVDNESSTNSEIFDETATSTNTTSVSGNEEPMEQAKGEPQVSLGTWRDPATNVEGPIDSEAESESVRDSQADVEEEDHYYSQEEFVEEKEPGEIFDEPEDYPEGNSEADHEEAFRETLRQGLEKLPGQGDGNATVSSGGDVPDETDDLLQETPDEKKARLRALQEKKRELAKSKAAAKRAELTYPFAQDDKDWKDFCGKAKCPPSTTRADFVKMAYDKDNSKVLAHFVKNVWENPNEGTPDDKAYGGRLSMLLRRYLLESFKGLHETAKAKAAKEARRLKELSDKKKAAAAATGEAGGSGGAPKPGSSKKNPTKDSKKRPREESGQPEASSSKKAKNGGSGAGSGAPKKDGANKGKTYAGTLLKNILDNQLTLVIKQVVSRKNSKGESVESLVAVNGNDWRDLLAKDWNKELSRLHTEAFSAVKEQLIANRKREEEGETPVAVEHPWYPAFEDVKFEDGNIYIVPVDQDSHAWAAGYFADHRAVEKRFKAVPVQDLPDTVLCTVRVPIAAVPNNLHSEWDTICFLSDLPIGSKTSQFVKLEPFGTTTDRKILFRATREVITLLRQKGRHRRPGHLFLSSGNFVVYVHGEPLLDTAQDSIKWTKFAMK